MLLWFKDLTNVTEEVTIHRLDVSNWCHAPNFNIDGKKNMSINCFFVYSRNHPSPPPHPSLLPHTLLYGSENMAITQFILNQITG